MVHVCVHRKGVALPTREGQPSLRVRARERASERESERESARACVRKIARARER